MVERLRFRHYSCDWHRLLAFVWLAAALLFGAPARAVSLPQFLIVDYHPVAKTPVPGSPADKPLYDYTYRVDVRNAGANAADVTAQVRSRVAAVATPDAQATFGAVGARQTKTSTDTITVRATRWFDRRLDKRVFVNGRWQYQEPGADDTDAQVPGLPAAIPDWNDAVLAFFYDIKFQAVFQWSFAARGDQSAPTIGGLQPVGPDNDARPTIGASYHDEAGGSGIDTASVRLTVDGADVTDLARAGSTGATYRPAKALADGIHNATLTVADKSRNASTASWSFLVDTADPVITSPAPKDIRNASPDAVISADFGDQGSGIDPARTTLTVDRVDVTAQAVFTASSFRYKPAGKLSDGTHRVTLKVVDLAGNSTSTDWTFGVDSRGVAIVQQAPAEGTILPADSRPTIGAAFQSTGTSVVPGKTVLTVDGSNVTAQATVTANGISYTPAAPLAEGTHTVTLSVTDRRGYVAQSAWRFVTRTAPEITQVAPKDVILNAQATTPITARYRDTGAGIDTEQVRLLLDGVDVTAQAVVAADNVSLTPATPLPQGLHIVNLTVTDKAGNASTTTWRFTIDSGLPVVSQQQPKDVLVATPTPRIGASFADPGDAATGVDTARIRLYVDGTDVTAAAQVGAGTIAYDPPAPLKGGIHQVRLSVPDLAGNVVESTWTFAVDADSPVVGSTFLPADGSTLAADALLIIGATYEDAGGVDPAQVKLEVDGVNVTASAQVTPTGIGYTPAVPLAEGSHTANLTVKDRVGNTTVRSWTFVTRSAPEILDFHPGDASTIALGLGVSVDVAFRDVGSGIDPASARLVVDGVDVTASAQWSEGAVRYTPAAQTFPTGSHTVSFSVADKAGNRTEREWRFAMDAPSTTTIGGLQPARFQPVPFGTMPRIAATYADPSGIDVARVRVMVDNVDVTADAQVGDGGFSYQAGALGVGRHNVYLRVTNRQGREQTASWSFDIDNPALYSVTFLDLPDGKGFDVPQAEVKVAALSDNSYVDNITLNGKPMTLVSADGRRAVYSTRVDLRRGDNTLAAVATFTDKRSKEGTVTVNYQTAPQVTIATPADRSTLGAAVDSSPRDLTGNVERPVTITGTVDRAVQSVTINQQQATVSGTGFRFDRFFLHEGTNLLTVVATDEQGRTGTASVTVSVDQTAPFLAVEAPFADSVTSANTIDVRGTVNDAVEGYYAAPEPKVVVSAGARSVTAQVGDKQFLAAAVPLELGENLLTVTATDEMGNRRGSQVRVVRVAAGGTRLTTGGGNGQHAPAGGALEQPFTVAAVGADGKAVAGLPVTFDVTRGTGSLAGSKAGLSAPERPRNLVVVTDENGQAQVWMMLGKQSGPGSNAVRASAAGVAEDLHFTASGDKGAPRHIRADLGINQYVATGTQPLEPLTAVVTDEHENRIGNAPVTFTVADGDARFENGATSITVVTDKNGYAAVRPTLGSQPGLTIVKAVPEGNGDDFFEATFTMQGLKGGEGPTRFSGTVSNDKGQPLPGARISIGRTALSTTVDEKGLFAFDDVPPGKIDLFVDGRTVNVQGQQYPALHFEATAIRGAANQLPHPIYLPQLDMAEARIVGGDKDVVLKMPGIEGYEMTVFANSVTFPDGSKTGPLVVSPISFDKLPMTPPGGFAGFMAPAATIQPSGTRFDPPVRLKIPNTAGLKPGEKKPVYQWDHDLATFVQMGQATVTEDAAFLITDPGTGISKAGWHPIPNPPPPDDCPSGGAPECPECQALSSTGGKCPKKSCKPAPGSCDDQLYCTKDDRCENGSCKGTKIEDTPDKPVALTQEVNLAVLNEAYRILNTLGLLRGGSTGGDPAFKVSLETSSQTHCCESEKKFTTIKKQKMDGKMNLGFGPLPIPGLSIVGALPPGVCFGVCKFTGGVMGSADFSAGIGFEKKASDCSDDSPCWQGSGKVSVEITIEGGFVLQDGPVTLAKATVGAKSGFDAGILANCDSGQLAGAYFQGVKVQGVLEFFDGGIHYDISKEIYEGYAIPGVSFPLP